MTKLPNTNKKLDQALDCAYTALDTMRSKDNDILYCLEEDTFYIYKYGLWEQIFETQLIEICCSCVQDLLRFTVNLRKTVIENMKMLCFKNLADLNNGKLMNLENYMVEPLSGNSLEHNKNYYSTIRIPYKYNFDEQCPLWLKSLNEIFEDNAGKVLLLQEFFGYCLIPDVKQKKALLLMGDSDSGKSTILNILRDMLGAQNSSSVPLKYLANPQYTPMMVNKLANIDPDVGKDAANFEGDFKIITSGEPVSCNQKFVATFKFIPYCRIVLAANIFPNITDHSSAFYKRLLVIPCERIFSEDEKNRNLSEQLQDELPGILNWAIEGLKRLNERGRFEQNKFSTEAVEELRELNNPVDTFIKETIEVSMESEVDKEILYMKYKEWCFKYEVGPLSNIKFNKCVSHKFSRYTGKDCRSSKPGRPRVWRNLGYINNVDGGQQVDWRD